MTGSRKHVNERDRETERRRERGIERLRGEREGGERKRGEEGISCIELIQL